MNTTPCTSLQRVLAALGHQEPDRVPFFLLFSTHGARELGISLREYFHSPEAMAEAQVRLRARYRHDCLSGFSYGAADVEAWGGEVIFVEDGPPCSGEPFLRHPRHIDTLEPPRIEDSPCLLRVLDTLQRLKSSQGDEAPILGVIISPFSLPVMQMGFEAYLVLMHEDPERFQQLMRVNMEFSVAWANAQLEAGATAICYVDPVSSPTVVSRPHYLETGFRVACSTIARIQGPTATHLASGRCLSIVDDLARTGTLAVGVSAMEDLARVKEACRNRLTVIGNLNGLDMVRWTPQEAASQVRAAMEAAGPGGGFILSDHHGEIPFRVPHEVLEAISETVHLHGHYPLGHATRGLVAN